MGLGNGMNVVLERLRNGGIVAVLEGMRRDREGLPSTMAAGGPIRSDSTTMWRQAWLGGSNKANDSTYVEDDDD